MEQKRKRKLTCPVNGNYDKYYSKRIPSGQSDPRLDFLQVDWLAGKDVLDVGCNDGTFALSLAEKFYPKSITGIDIDPRMISAAQKLAKERSIGLSQSAVKFIASDYVPSDFQIALVKPEYDCILILSVTKWVHFNHGDAGIHRLFRRAYANLRTGGRLILEAQPYSTYSRKIRLLAPEQKAHYKSINLKPEKFTEYLMSDEVGFKLCQCLNDPECNNLDGFSRPLYVLTK